ncbi:MAG: carotenoid biosynthesis protein [Spirochaetales bacterium]|nr:carotenoid biosynthesis protein [Spirochaetales bacterium]
MKIKKHLIFWHDFRSMIKNLAIIYLIGIAGHVIPATRTIFIFITPVSLLLINILVLLHIFPFFEKRLFLFCGITFLFTFVIEIIGVHTHAIFGAYTYGKTLGPTLLGVPPLIGLNWLIILIGAAAFVELLFKKKFLIPVIVPLMAVAVDIIMEPVAGKLDYWQWENTMVPLQNYLAWAGIAFIVSLLYTCIRIKITSAVPAIHLGYQAVFFLALLLFV